MPADALERKPRKRKRRPHGRTPHGRQSVAVNPTERTAAMPFDEARVTARTLGLSGKLSYR